jgi:hypothetical protein
LNAAIDGKPDDLDETDPVIQPEKEPAIMARSADGIGVETGVTS